MSTQFINRAYSDINENLKPYRRTRTWLMTEKKDDALKVLIINKDIIESLPAIQEHVPENSCIYAFQAPLVMLYTKRITGRFPSLNSESISFLNETNTCQFLLALPLTDISGRFPSYYPIKKVINNPNYEIIPIRNPKENNKRPNIFLIKRIN